MSAPTQAPAWPAGSPLDPADEWARVGGVLALAGLPAPVAAYWVRLRLLAAERLAPVVATQVELARLAGVRERMLRGYHEALARLGLLVQTRRGPGPANLVPVATPLGLEVARRAIAAGLLEVPDGEAARAELEPLRHRVRLERPELADIDALVAALAGYRAAAAGASAAASQAALSLVAPAGADVSPNRLETDTSAAAEVGRDDPDDEPGTAAMNCRSSPDAPDRPATECRFPGPAADGDRQPIAAQCPGPDAARYTVRQHTAGQCTGGPDCRCNDRQWVAVRAGAAAPARLRARGGGGFDLELPPPPPRANADGGRERDEREVAARVAECGQFAADVRRALERHLPYERAGHTKAWDRATVARARLEFAEFVRDQVRDLAAGVLADALGALNDRTLEHPHAARVWLRTAITRRAPVAAARPAAGDERVLRDLAAEAEARERAAADAERERRRRCVREQLAALDAAEQLELAVQRRLGAERVTVDGGRARAAAAHDYATTAAIAEARTALVDALAQHLAGGALAPGALDLLSSPTA